MSGPTGSEAAQTISEREQISWECAQTASEDGQFISVSGPTGLEDGLAIFESVETSLRLQSCADGLTRKKMKTPEFRLRVFCALAKNKCLPGGGFSDGDFAGDPRFPGGPLRRRRRPGIKRWKNRMPDGRRRLWMDDGGRLADEAECVQVRQGSENQQLRAGAASEPAGDEAMEKRNAGRKTAFVDG